MLRPHRCPTRYGPRSLHFERDERLPNLRAADAKTLGQRAFGSQASAKPDVACRDQVVDLVREPGMRTVGRDRVGGWVG